MTFTPYRQIIFCGRGCPGFAKYQNRRLAAVVIISIGTADTNVACGLERFDPDAS
jgi:hypothetical protein